MSYKDFTIEKIESLFKINFNRQNLFENIISKEPSKLLLEILERSNSLFLTTEKAKSEFIISQILSDIVIANKKKVSLFSGEVINADRKLGLSGELDFIFSKSVKVPKIQAPLITVIEAKKADIDSGIEQCCAQLVGLKVFNEKKQSPVFPLYGCVTNSHEWLFIKLDKENNMTIDIERYFINELSTILGIFQRIIEKF